MEVPLDSDCSVDEFIENTKAHEAVSGSYLLESLETRLDVYEEQLVDLNKFCDKLTSEYSHKVLIFTHFCHIYEVVHPNYFSSALSTSNFVSVSWYAVWDFVGNIHNTNANTKTDIITYKTLYDRVLHIIPITVFLSWTSRSYR